MLLKDGLEERLHGVTEDDWVGDLHHRGLHVEGEQNTLVAGVGDLGVEEFHKGSCRKEGRVDDLACLDGNRSAEGGHGTVGTDVFDAEFGGVVHHHRPLVLEEVTARHAGNVTL